MKSQGPPSAAVPPRRLHLYIALGLVLLTLAAYSNSFTTGFAMDNRGLILEDARIRDASAENLGLIVDHTYWWPYGESGLYRPFTTLTYLFNYAILGNGASPAGYHWVNFLLHAANVLLLYLLALRLAAGVWRAAWIAALWAVHPVLTESVTNIVGRADLLAGMCVLGGFYLYLKSTESAGARRWLCLGALSLVTAAGVFAKESAVTLLGVIVLYEVVWWRERRQARGLLYGALATLLPIQIMLYQRAAVLFAAQPTNFPFYDNPIVGMGWLYGRVLALEVTGRYLGLLAFPLRLSSDYSWKQIAEIGYPLVWLLPAAAAIWLLRSSRMAWFLAGTAFLVFLPTSNLLFPIGTIMAERFLYLPAIAFAAALVVAAQWASARVEVRWALPAMLGLLVAVYAGRTWLRNRDWQSDLTLSEAAVNVSPESYKSHLMLANSLFDSDPGHGNLDRILAEGEKSLAILQPLPAAWNNAGAIRRVAMWYLAKGDPPAANRAIELLARCKTMVAGQLEAAQKKSGFDPKVNPLSGATGEIDRLISAAYLKLGDTGRALDSAAGAIEADPENPELYRQRAQSLLAAGQPAQAVAVLMEGVMMTMDPGLRQNVVQAYQSLSGGSGCALMPLPNGTMAINPRCDTVHTQLCDATAAAIRRRVKMDRRDLAGQLRVSGVNDFSCAAAPLDAALK